jgi:hypothetical protein
MPPRLPTRSALQRRKLELMGGTGKFSLNADFHGTFRDLLHAANLRHGTHGFTSLPKDGALRIFPPLKIRRLRPGLNPRTWVPEASTLTPRPPKPLVLGLFILILNELRDCYLLSSRERETNYSCLLVEY